MLLNEEEEKKKREEARRIMASSGMKIIDDTKDEIVDNINYSNNVVNNSDYQKKLEEARQIMEFSGMKILDDEIEEPVIQEEPITQDETENTKVTPQMLVTNTTPSTDYELESIRNKDNNKAKVDEKQLKNVQANANLVNPQNNNDGNMAISNFRAGQNLNPIVDKTNVDNKGKNETTTIKATQNANIASKDDVKNVKKASNSDIYLLTNGQVDYRSQTEKSIDSFAGTVGNIGEGVKDFVPSIVDYLATGTENGSKITIRKGLKLLGYSDEDIEKITNVAMENYKKMSPLSVLNNLLNNDYKNNLRNERIQKNILKASSNSFTKKLAEVAPSIGSNLASSTLTAVNPVLGMMSFIFSAGGSYLDDAEARGMNDEEAFTYASIMGVLEGGTEYIITGKAFSTLLKAFSGKGLSKEVLNSYGVSTAENFLQEFVMEPFQEATAMVTGGADKADWDNIWGRALEAGCDGVLSSIILGGASAGIGSAQKVINKANPTVNEYAQALTDSINSGKVDVKGIVNGAKQAIIDNGGTQQFYTTTFNQDGNIENVQAVKGKAINNPNSNVNVAPVIIKNENNLYNVIDKNTGILLDSTPYKNMDIAQKEFNNKMINLDSASINNINNQIAKATIAIENELNKNVQEQNTQASNENVTNNNQTVTNTSQSGQENVQNDIQSPMNNVNVNPNVDTNIDNSTNTYQNNNPDTYQTSQNQFTDDYNSETTNYTSSNANAPTSQNNVLQDIQETVSKISDNTIYKTEEASNVFRTIARNIPTIELQVNENGASLNSLNENGELVYSQKLSGRPYRGAKIKQIINNAISNADTSNINTIQINQNGFRDVSNNETTNYMSDDRNVNVKQNNKLSDEEIRNIVKYNPDGREISDENYVDFLVDRYKDNKNISGVVTDTKYVESRKNNTEKEILDNLYSKIDNKSFKTEKKLLNEQGKNVKVLIDLEITKQGLKESFNKSISPEKLSVIPYIDTLIETSNDGIIRPENKNRRNILNWYYLYNTAEINGQLYGVKIDLKKTQVGDRFYVHRVNLINNKGNISSVPGFEHATERNNISPSVNTSIPQQNKNVKSNTGVNNQSMQNNENNTQLQQDTENFSNQVDAVLDGTFPKRSMLTLLSHTPKPLLDIGLQDFPITMTQRHLDTIMNESGNDKNANYHGLGVDTVRQLPEAISNPLDIVKSNTKDDSIVLTTYLADSNNNTIIASIKIDGKGLVNQVLIDTNVMTSAYGKDNYDKFMQDNIKNGNLLYDIDRGVIKKVDVARFQLPGSTNSRATEARLQLPRSSNSTTNTNGSISSKIIPQNYQNVKGNNSTITNQSMQNNENNTKNLGGNENVEQERFKRNTYDGQEVNRKQETNDRERENSNGQSDGSIKEELSVSLSNYAQEKSRQTGQNVKAKIINKQDYTDYEKTISEGFIEATGLDINIYETNKGTSEGAFYSGSNIFLKHDSMGSKKATNFKPYHELGHWIKNNYSNEWNKLYDIINNTITNEQIEQYKNVLNDKTIFDNMTNQEAKDYVINEIISDYLGNWSNNIKNWEDYILNGTISKQYADLLADISLENEVTGYNVFGSIEQQEQMYDEISRIMYNVISNRGTNAVRNNTNNAVKYSDRQAEEYSDTAKKNVENLYNQLQDWLSLKMKYDDYFKLGNTPKSITDTNNNISNLPIIMTQDVISKVTGGKHSIALDEIAKIPGELENPVLIIEGSIPNSYMILTTLESKDSNNVFVVLHFNKLQKRLKVNRIASIYGKNNLGNFLEKNIQEGKIIQHNSKKLKELITNRGLQLPKLVQSTLIDSSISQVYPSVKSDLTTTNTNNMQNNKNNTSKTQKSDRDMNENAQAQTDYDKKIQQENRKIAKLIKERSFFTNVYNSNVPDEFKKTLIKHRQEYKYTPISNETTLENARKKVENIKNIRDEFMQNEIKNAEDTAVGELLIHQAIAQGNYEEANTLTSALADKLTTAGQTIQAAAMFHRMTPEGMLLYAQRQINNINKELQEKFKLNKLITKKDAPQIKLTEDKIEFIKNLTEQLQELEKAKSETTSGVAVEAIERQEDILIGKIVAKIGEDVPVTMLDKLSTWRNISLLLNPKTIVRNVVSNSMFVTLENVTDTFIGVPIDKLVSLITGQRSLLMPNLKTQAKGFKKGLEYAVEDTRMGISTSLGGNKYEIKPNKNFKNKYLQVLETASYFGVEGMDRPFMQQVYDGALEMIMKLEGLEYGKDIPTEAMKQEALEIAQYRTFKDKNEVSDFLSKVKKSLNLGKSIGAADVIGLTYTNIPGNLTKKTIDYSPLGLYNVLKAYKQLRLNQMNGESTRQAQRQLVQSISRTLIGSGIMAVSMQAFLAGVLTASGDDEDDRIRELTGKENYAININALIRWITGGDTTPQNGDFYITYSNYEPLSAIMSAAAEMMGAIEQGENIGTAVYKGITTWINTIAELSTLSNFSNLFEFGDLGGSIIRSISQFPATFIPTFFKQIAQFFEPSSKSNYSDDYIEKNIFNPMKQRIPGLNSTLESSYDTMGNEKKSFNGSTGLGRIYDVFLNTSYTSTVDMDSTEQEIYDLYTSTGLTDHLPLTVKNSFTYKGEKITLTAKEKAQYQKELGERTAKAYKERMQTKEYQNMTDEEKVQDLAKILSDLQIEVRGEVVLEPRGLAYDSTFTPSSSSLSYNGYKLNLTPEMQQEYEKIASDMFKKYENQGLYNEEYLEKIKTKVKDAAKKKMMQKYRSQLVK